MSWPCKTCGAVDLGDAARACTARIEGCAPLVPVPCAGFTAMDDAFVAYEASRQRARLPVVEVVN